MQTVDVPTAVRILKALWEYREAMRERFGHPEKMQGAKDRFEQLIGRIQGGPNPAVHPPAAPAWPVIGQPSPTLVSAILADLMALPQLEPHPRGYAFEKFLKRLFDAYGLEARDAFKLKGEQIDGSFQLANETYLLEAKWQNAPSGVADLHGFHGKIEQKAAWTRGLFISNNGFSADGFEAFERGKRVICMDGYRFIALVTPTSSMPAHAANGKSTHPQMQLLQRRHPRGRSNHRPVRSSAGRRNLHRLGARVTTSRAADA